jgi:His-Xaa-Ser system radical SAM maturase HxsB
LRPELFRPAGSGYRLLPFRFMRWPGGEVLVVNEVGEHLFLRDDTLRALVNRRLPRDHPDYLDLKAKHFLCDDLGIAIDLLATQYRTKKSFLEGFTKLHMFVVTLRCDHSCRYCQVSRVSDDRPRYDMSEETARQAVDLMFCSPSPGLKVEFQGGEPLLNFDRIRSIVERCEEINQLERRDVEYVVATNLAPLTDEMLCFFRDHRVLLSTSLDGPQLLHDANRPRRGNNSYALTLANLHRAREVLGQDRISATMTTTQRSLDLPREIVDEYVRQGFSSIFLRAVSPYGFALRTGEAQRYAARQFLDFYKQALSRIIEVNRQGYSLVEVYSQILLTKMLTPFATGYVDLQSPAGAGIGAVAYNYDGDVYAGDEARMLGEMGDRRFRLGNVHRDPFEEIFHGETLQALVTASITEAMPGCAECAFLPFCGADPIFHHATQGDVVGHRPTSAFCARNMGMLTHLFNLLRGGDAFTVHLLTGWATGGQGVGPEINAETA